MCSEIELKITCPDAFWKGSTGRKTHGEKRVSGPFMATYPLYEDFFSISAYSAGAIRAAMASVNSIVLAEPPRSGVTVFPSASTENSAASIRSAADPSLM